MKKIILSMPWVLLIAACLTIGLAPYNPPHILEKSAMLISGRLVTMVDWFDFFMHGLPWFLLVMKALVTTKSSKEDT